MSKSRSVRTLLRAAAGHVARSLVRQAQAQVASPSMQAEALEPRQMLARASGIDVSHYSGTINWSSVASAGYAFAYAKATEGASVVDADMTANLAGGASAGVLMGAYHHAKPDAGANDAVNEANWFVQKAGNFIKPGYLRPALDVSEGATGTTGGTLSKAQLSAWVNTFCSTVKSATGVDPVVYTNNDYATTYLDGSVGANHDLWIARWSTAYGPPTTTGSPPVGAWGTAGETWDFWQYSNTGTVSGVPGGADLDVFNGDRAALDAFVIGATAPPSFALGLDFGPTGATVPSGYVNVANTLVGTQGNQQMGWLQSGVTTDSRTAGTAPDVRYRTFAMPALGGVSRSFEVAVPNGSYTVHVVTGSPDQYPNVQRITVEGVTAVNASTSSTQPFIGGTVTVNVTDGRLTLGSDYNGAANTRLDYVDITSNTPAVSTGVQTQVTFGVEARKAVPGYFNDYGQPYGVRRTGETFGWVAVAGGASASNVGSGFGHGGTSDDRRKQGIATGGKTWEMDVPSGTYWVKLVAGDGNVTSGTYGYDVEGTSGLSLRGTAGTDNARWITAEGPVTVSDGRLTITRAGGMANDALAYVEVMDYLARGRTAVSAPTGVTITSAGDNVTDVRWVDRSDNETGFKVERGTSATGPWTLLKTTYANAGLYEDGGGDDGATYYYRVTAVQRETGASAPVVSNALTTPDVDHRHARSPYNATRVAWDGTSRIEAEDYDVSGAYVAYDDLSDGNAGGYYRGGNGDVGYNAPNARYFVGWTKQGEWNEYTINLAESGRYKFEMSVASPAVGGKFSVLVNGATKWSNLQVPNTGSFTSYQTISTGEQSLSAGTSLVVRVLASADDPTNHDWVADVDWFRLVKAGTPSVPTVSIAATQPSSVGEDSGTPVTFTVTLSGAQGLSEPIEVPLSIAGTGTYNDDYTILTQGAGQFLPTHVTFTPPAGGFSTNDQTYTILVRPVADSNVEPNETVVATLGDAGYGDYQLSSSSTASATILNDDGSGVVTPPTVGITASTSSVAEDSRTPVTFTVTLLGAEGGTSAITVPLSVSGDATSPSDYTVLTQSNGTAIPPSVTFTPTDGVFGAGAETYAFTVTPVADTDVEPDEYIAVALGTGSAYTFGSLASASLAIVDDDGGSTNSGGGDSGDFIKDSDGDGLPDKWEQANGMDPTNSDEDEDGTPDGLDDADDDGLTNEYEAANGLNIRNTDSDGDGSSDKNETDGGADPTDPSDKGVAFPSDMYKIISLHAEDGGSIQVGPYTATSSLGQPGTDRTIRLKKGETYSYHIMYGGSTSYLTRSILGTVNILTDDQVITDPTSPFPTLIAESGSFLVPEIDLIIDSQNALGYGIPNGSIDEQRLENEHAKFGLPDDGDLDGDGVADDLELNAVSGRHFVPVVVHIPQIEIDAWNASGGSDYYSNFQLNCQGYGDNNGADPGLILEDISQHILSAYDSIRLWTKDGIETRTIDLLPDATSGGGICGDLISAGRPISFRELDSSGNFTFYAELTGANTAGTYALSQITAEIHCTTGHMAHAPFTPPNSPEVYTPYSSQFESDQVHIGCGFFSAYVDNDRGGTVNVVPRQANARPLGDATSAANPFIFWTNDNNDQWGGLDYPAAISGETTTTIDSSTTQIGADVNDSEYAEPDQSVAEAETRAILERDLEDFAEVGVSWQADLFSKFKSSNAAKTFRIRIEDPTQSGLTLRFMPSAFADDAFQTNNNTDVSATGHTDKSSVIDQIIKSDPNFVGASNNDRLNPLVVRSGSTGSWDLDSNFSRRANLDERNLVTADPKTDIGRMMLMFEGVHPGVGSIYFEFIDGNGVTLASTKVDVHIHALKELYDHYSVSSGANVDSSTLAFNAVAASVLDSQSPVSTVATLVGINEERTRIKGRSKDYFLFVHGWNMSKKERIAYAESAYKRLFWSGYAGQFGMFDWPTQTVADPTADPGNFDRSEYVAWNSAAGLRDTISKIRAGDLQTGGRLTVLAHSMGGVVASEAVNAMPANSVDTLIYTQAAVSEHYFSGALPDELYQGTLLGDGDLNRRAATDGSTWLYDGFGSDEIGGSSPRFASFGGSTQRVINLYNQVDYALTGWRYDQVLKPWYSVALTEGAKVPAVPPGTPIDLEAIWSAAYHSRALSDYGFGGVTYIGSALSVLPGDLLLSSLNTGVMANLWRVLPTASDATSAYGGRAIRDSALLLAGVANEYERLAFGAGSVAEAIGQSNAMNGVGPFTNASNLRDLSPKFDASVTGHSAEFVGSYSAVKGYWDQVVAEANESDS